MEESSGFFAGEDAGYGNGPLLADNDFTDLQPMAGGGSGFTRLYTGRRRGKRFVLKCLQADYRHEAGAVEMLLKEFTLGYNLSHPNIVQTVGLEEIDSLGPAIVLEWIDGETLADALAGGHVSRGQGRRIMQLLAEAVDYLHAAQLTHRDIKPTNIMITRGSGVAKLIDFGFSDSADYLVLKTPAGTDCYAAPEQHGDDADTRADAYALGRVAQEIGIATGDRRLRCLGARCMHPRPERRPDPLAGVPWEGNRHAGLGGWIASAGVLAAAAAVAFLTPREGGTKVERVEVPVAVHDTVVMTPPVDTARVAFKQQLQGQVERIARTRFEQMVRAIERDTADVSRKKDLAVYYQEMEGKARGDIEGLVRKQVPEDDAEHFTLLSAALHYFQTERDRLASENGERIIAAYFGRVGVEATGE